MDLQIITPLLKDLLFPKPLFETMAWYVLSLMIPSDLHSQAFASRMSGKDNSLFSDLLAKDTDLSLSLLNRSSKRRLRKLMRKRKKLFKDAPWTITLIIDATLHTRSSRRINNAQKFNHGKGFITGHQWTNTGVLVAGEFIPLKAIPFFTKQECKKRGTDYKTEHEKVVNFLRNFSFKEFGQDVDPSEIVVLLDSGYDNKLIQKTVKSRKWDFVVSLKSDRQISVRPKEWLRVDKFFKDGRRGWKSLGINLYRKKKKSWKKFQVKQREGFLKGTRLRVNLVCSKRSKDRATKHFASSNLSVSTKTILSVYQMRWRIEIFHREVKSYLGLEDAGVKRFDSLINHVHYVYVAYNLLHEKYGEIGMKKSQLNIESELKIKKSKKCLKIISWINNTEKLKNQFQSDIERLEMLIAA